MMTLEEIKLIRTILEDEVTTWEWNLENDTSLDKTWTLEYLNNARMALEVFNRETRPFLSEEIWKLASMETSSRGI